MEFDVEITRITKHKVKVEGPTKRKAMASAKEFATMIASGSSKADSALIQDQERIKFIDEIVTGGKK